MAATSTASKEVVASTYFAVGCKQGAALRAVAFAAWEAASCSRVRIKAAVAWEVH